MARADQTRNDEARVQAIRSPDAPSTERPAAAAPEAFPADRADRPGARVGPLLLALVLVCGLLVWQFLRADALSGQVEMLTDELAVAHEEIRMREQRMLVVREHVDDLSERVAALRTFVGDE